MSDSTFERILSELGQLLGISSLAPTGDGLCQLVFDGSLAVQLVDMRAHRQVLLSCALDTGPANAAHAELMAKANFMQAGCGVVACLAPDGRAHLQLSIPLTECNGQALATALETLLNQAETWQMRLRDQAANIREPIRNPAVYLQSV
ncbi:type III secretion system chaperone [Bordetella sp. BOR01]|uniref:type III secretion system chaperone n=1 Tax=Bordetella sp. BOR01 TaxID=2854779 RepID=UPI001C45A2AA|nr:type III secretion system chaperone [Bordetella sp. BOR01]